MQLPFGPYLMPILWALARGQRTATYNVSKWAPREIAKRITPLWPDDDVTQKKTKERKATNADAEVLGPKYYTYNGFWELVPSRLSTWTFRQIIDSSRNLTL